MKNLTFLKKIFASTLLTFLFTTLVGGIALPVYAQQKNNEPCSITKTATSTIFNKAKSKDEYCLLAPIVVDGKEVKSVDVAGYIKEMFKIGIGLAGVFAVFMIVWGGLEYASTDAISGKSAGKEKIEGALWGLGLALGSFLILNTINPELLQYSGGLEPVDKDLAKRQVYTDESLRESMKIDQIRRDLDDCNAQEKQLRDQGNIGEADALKLKCKVVAARESVLAKINMKDLEVGKFWNSFKPLSEADRKTIIDAGKASISKYYDDEIEKTKNKQKEIEKSSGKKDESFIKGIEYLKVNKSIDLLQVDQDYDTEKALRVISSFGTNGASKIEAEVNKLKGDMAKRANDEYYKLSKTYPKEADFIRSYTAEKVKKITDAYKEGLGRLDSNTNNAYGPTIGG